LIEKLKQFGFAGSLLLWFKSSLSDKYQIVKYHNYESYPTTVTSRVPQGDHLSILLLFFFFYDLPVIINNSTILLFTDDVKLIKIINNQNNCIELQSDLRNLNMWCNINNL